MKTYTLILLLFLMASVCGAHDDWVSGSTDRQHLSGADLNNYLHGHKEIVDGTIRTGFWDYDPDVDNAWEKTQANWEASGCVTEDANGKKLYNHDCYNAWIKQGNLEPTENQTPTNSPTQHSGCYGSGAEHFHRLDSNNYGHGLDHSGHVFVSGVMSGIHRHPACEEPCTDCGTPDGERDLPDDPFGNTEDESVGASVLTSDDGIKDDTVAPTSTDEFTGLPQPRTSLGTLRITYLSYDDNILTLQLTAYSPSTAHNHLVIRVNEQDFITPALFFGRFELTTDEIRQVSFAPHTNGRSVILTRSEYSRLANGKAHTVSARTQGVAYGWDSITDFDIENFVVRLRNYASETDRDIVRQADIGADGNRIGSVGGAPSHAKPKLVTVWAALKRQ